MSSQLTSYFKHKLSYQTSFLGLRLWIIVVSSATLLFILLISLISCCFACFRRRKPCKSPFCLSKNYHQSNAYCSSSLNRRLLPRSMSEIEMNSACNNNMMSRPEFQVMFPDQWSTHHGSSSTMTDFVDPFHKFISHGKTESWIGNRFSSREVGSFTNGFAYDNVIGNGDYGVVYRGVLLDGTTVAVKRLLSNSCQTEGFMTEADSIGHIRHKNIVKLLGYCMEEGYRMLVYEYVNNSNLHEWLHGPLGESSPLTWMIRTNIIHGIAKGLAYLHEDIEPHIVHQNLKASNILLDHLWNPKISDVALSRLLGPDHALETTRSLVKLGYADQEHASTSRWDEKSDVYSFGILVMEILSGRIPVDDHPQHQIYLIDWLKFKVANKKIEYVVDPNMPEIPSIKELKRIILIALRCVDSDLDHRPKMGEVIHMLEPRNFMINDERRIRREASLRNQSEGYRPVV